MTIIPFIAIFAIITIIEIIAYYSYYCNYFWIKFWLLSCRMVGVCWISSGIRAWLQETCLVRHSHSEYSGQTSCGTCRWHWNCSAPHVKHFFGRSRRPQAGRRRWMPNVVRQLVGIGMVPWHVINLTGLHRAMPQGERFHVITMRHYVWAMLPSALAVLWQF